MGVGDGGDTVIGVVGGHDGGGTTVQDGTLKRGEVEGAEFTLTTVDWGGVDALLGSCKGSLVLLAVCPGDRVKSTYKVLDHGGNATILKTLGESVCHLSSS